MAAPIEYTKAGKRPYVPPSGIKTHYTTLDYESSTYWIFEASDVPDPIFPDAWKSISKFCRWWVTDHGRPDDLRDVSGILQLSSAMSGQELRDHVDPLLTLTLVPSTLAIQVAYLPSTNECQKFVVHEYGDQRFPKAVTKLPTYNSNLTPQQARFARIAVAKGMNSRDARVPQKVVEFFRQRKLNNAPTTPTPSKRQRRVPSPPKKHLTQSLGDIPDPNFDFDSDGHITTDEDEINCLEDL